MTRINLEQKAIMESGRCKWLWALENGNASLNDFFRAVNDENGRYLKEILMVDLVMAVTKKNEKACRQMVNNMIKMSQNNLLHSAPRCSTLNVEWLFPKKNHFYIRNIRVIVFLMCIASRQTIKDINWRQDKWIIEQ
jgi:aspartyl/asparaginyl-tRNA synthetase